eukprot:scaffold5886_cov161-Amphora_coffeaeformis.AAC.5
MALVVVGMTSSWQNVEAFTVTPKSLVASWATTVPTSSTSSLPATFATENYLNGLSQIHDTTATTDPYTYIENVYAFTAEAAETTSTLWNSAANDDMWRRIAMAAEYQMETSPLVNTNDAAVQAMDSFVQQQPQVVTPTMLQDMAATPVAADTATTAAAVPDMPTAVDPLKAQLADFANLYKNNNNNLDATVAAEKTTKSLSGLAQSLGEWTQSSQKEITEAWTTFGANTGKILRDATADTTPPGPVLDGTRILERGTSAVMHAPVYVMEQTKAAVKLVTADLSIEQVAERMGQTLAYLGKTFILVLNVILESITGDTLADVLQGAQTTIQDLTSGAMASVVQTAHQIGDMTISEALVSMAKLIALITTVLFRILSGVLELVTGKNAGEWGALAAKAVQQEAQEVVVAASATASDLSHKSLAEVVNMLGQFEQQAATAVMQTTTLALDNMDSTMAVANTLSSQ